MAAAFAAGIRGGNILDANGEDTWLSVYLIQTVAKSIKGAITGPSLIAALNQAHKINVLGIIKNWTPSAVGPPNEPRVTNHTYYLEHINTAGQIVGGPA